MCHLLLSSKEDKAINVGKVVVKSSRNKKLQGVSFAENASFGYHIQNTCIKASSRLQALAIVARNMDLSKGIFLMNATF